MSHFLRQAMYSTAHRFPRATFNSARALVIPEGVSPPDSDTVVYLHNLATTAHAISETLLCGSALAGQSSESDEFSDVAVWLGNGAFGRGSEYDVFNTLGIEVPSENFSNLEFAPKTNIPSTLKGPSALLDPLSAEIAKLEDVHFFSAPSGPYIFYSLLGKIGGGWGGLLGIGVSSDN